MAGVIFSKGSGLNDSVYGKSYEPIKMAISGKAEAFEKLSVLPHIFNMDKSSHFAEKTTGMTSMNGFQPVDEGGLFPEDEMQEGYSKTLEHVAFKDQFTITREMIDDSTVFNLRKKPVAFTTGYYRTREKFGVGLLANGASTTMKFGEKTFDTTCNDGLPLFSTAHKSVTGGATQSNYFSNAFSADTLALVETAMQNFKDDNGNILTVVPDTIIIPNLGALKKTVFAAINADKDPATANNGFNFLYGRWRVIICPYWVPAAGTSPYIVASSQYNEDYAGAMWFDRMKLEVKAYEDPKTWNMVWQGMARFSAGFNDWRAFVMGGITGATTLS
jgi:hypothetical protein